MAHRYECPTCGESTRVEVVPFFDDAGRAKLRLTCRLIVHEEPVVLEFNDPDAPSASQLNTGSGLVHDLELYSKLEEIVLGLEQPAEYGVIEHLFAHAYPEDYVLLWRRHGHVATHRSKRYTLSAYLGGLLGKLWRHGSIVFLPYHGTGRWTYNSGISAWANPRFAELPVLSWQRFAEQQGIDPEDWPAVALLPAEELPTWDAPTGYWVYDNRVHHYSRIHRADCSYCRDGDGIHDDAADVAGEWLGPYDAFGDARAIAARTGRDVSACRSCDPAR